MVAFVLGLWYSRLCCSVCRYFPSGPGVGSHVHLSIWQGENNVLMGKGSGSKFGMSKQGQEFMAGVLHHLPAIFAMTCTVPNRSVLLRRHSICCNFVKLALNSFVDELLTLKRFSLCFAVTSVFSPTHGVARTNAGDAITERLRCGRLAPPDVMLTWLATLS
jgi:hypothetical protein